MATLIRFISSYAAWDEPDLSRAKQDFALREGEAGLSLWRVESDAECDLVIAARALDRRRAEKADFVEFGEDEAEEFGLVTRTPGGYPLGEVNSWHRELRWTPEALTRFAEHLLEAGRKPRRKKRTKVKELLASLDVARVEEPARSWLESAT